MVLVVVGEGILLGLLQRHLGIVVLFIVIYVSLASGVIVGIYVCYRHHDLIYSAI